MSRIIHYRSFSTAELVKELARPDNTISVRTWFRKMRAAQFAADTVPLTLYFRTETPSLQGPFSPPVSIYTFGDFDKFIEHALAHEYPWRSLDDIHRMIYAPRSWKLLRGITE